MLFKDHLLLRAARGEITERTPVWVMRQAGRILSEYRAVRNKLSGFKELVETPQLAAEVTIQPIDILQVDAAIIFSDILVVPDAMGLKYQMVEKQGPYFPKTIRCSQDMLQLKRPNPQDLDYVYEAIRITKKELNNRVPLIGFAGAPWTIFAYMVEGAGSKTFSHARKILYQQPRLATQLLEIITQTTIDYLKGQIQAGVDMVQIFDSWAGILPYPHYSKFSLKYIQSICSAIQKVPITVFSKGAWWAFSELNQLPCEVIGLDWNMNPLEAKKVFTHKTLQGNLDPCVLYGSANQIRSQTKEMLQNFQGIPHIANLGHGIYPDTDPEKVKVFIESVKEISSKL